MPFFCFFLAVWFCLTMGSENMVLVRLLQIGAKGLTVKGEVPMVKKRGKEVPENNDRGVKHCQVRNP